MPRLETRGGRPAVELHQPREGGARAPEVRLEAHAVHRDGGLRVHWRESPAVQFQAAAARPQVVEAPDRRRLLAHQLRRETLVASRRVPPPWADPAEGLNACPGKFGP